MKDQQRIRCMMMTMLVMLVGIFASSQVIIRNNPIGSDANKASKVFHMQPNIDLNQYDVFQTPNSKTYVPKQKRLAHEEQQMVNVTCKLVYDENVYLSGYSAQIYNENDSYYLNLDWETGQLKGRVPIGTYDIFYTFSAIEPEKYGSTHVIIKEQIDIVNDTLIELRQDEITNKIECIARNQYGEQLTHRLGNYDENGQFIVTEEGNIMFTDRAVMIYANGCGPVASIGSSFGEATYNQTESCLDLRINDVSDRYKIIISKTSYDFMSNTWYVNKYYPENVHVGTIECNPENYKFTQEVYKPSVLGNESNWKAQGIMVDYIFYDYLMPGTFMTAITMSNNDEIEMNAYINSPYENGSFNMFAIPYYGDSRDGRIPTWTSGVPMATENNEIRYYNYGYFLNLSADQFMNDVDNHHNNRIHPAFSFAQSQKSLEWGSTVPVASLANMTYYDDWYDSDYLVLGCDYFGQLGESRKNDLLAIDMNLKYNDEVICDNYSNLPDAVYAMIEQGMPAGTIEATFINENIEVNGLLGRNTMNVYFDQTNDDGAAPTMRMLQMRRNDGVVTNCFTWADEGVIQFSCGDFNYHMNTESWYAWFDCDDAPIVVVQYSPYHDDNWKELEVEEIPELFFMPGFGYFYRGSLASVTGEAYEGWFDLKIRLEDAAGNWQEQVISPAFRIDDLAYSNVATVGSDNAHEVARYSLDGKRVDMNHRGVTIVKMSDGTARKVIQ